VSSSGTIFLTFLLDIYKIPDEDQETKVERKNYELDFIYIDANEEGRIRLG
jgi:hypothetical protein